ncbi:MAG: ankyrin repeat domain-containing protein [Spirochaetales bacterium]|nr:ankyrin repeat domain-containing protein [Spirochaetales bacterium]
MNKIWICISLIVVLFNISCVSSDIHKMVREGDREKLQKLYFKQGVSVDERDEEGKTPLYLAIELGFDDIAKFLIDIGADPNIPNNEGQTPLFIASEKNNLQIVELLLKAGADIDSKDSYGRTAMYYAVYTENFRMMEILKENGADIFIRDDQGNSPASIAIEKGRLFVPYLIDKDNVNTIGADNFTSLSAAVMVGEPEVVRYLLSIGAKPGVGKCDGKSEVEYAFFKSDSVNYAEIAIILLENRLRAPSADYDYIQYYVDAPKISGFYSRGGFPLHNAAARGHKGFVEYFLQEKFDQNIFNENGLNALNLSIKNKQFAVADILIRKGAKINSRTPDGDTALTLLLKVDKEEKLANLILDSKASIDVRNNLGESPLFLAIANNYSQEFIKKIIEMKADISIRNNDGVTALHKAIEMNLREITEILVKKSSNIHARDNVGRTPYKMALEKGFEFLTWFTEVVDVNSRDDNGNSLVHVAISNDADADVVKLLLVRGAKLDQKNIDGDTAFHLALRKENESVSRLLLESDANLFLQNRRGETPMVLALRSKWNNAQWLLTDKFLKAKDYSGNTPLHSAIDWGLSVPATSLIKLGANINEQNNFGQTPLHIAILKSRIDLVKLLFDNDVDTSVRDSAGNTAYHYIVYNNSLDLLPYFENRGIELDTANIYGKTPLYEAFVHNANQIAEKLIEQGAKIDIRDNWGKTPFHAAAESGNTSGCMILIKNKASFSERDNSGNTPLHYAVLNNKKQTADYLKRLGADVYASNKSNQTPVDIVLENKEKADWFIDSAYINLPDNNGRTPLHIALENKASMEIIRLLVEKKNANLNSKDMSGEIPLHYAMKTENYDAAKFLLSKNSNIFYLNKDGMSPLYMAMEKGTKVLDWFITAENLNSTDNQGNTPLHLAAIRKDVRLYDYFSSRGADETLKNRDGYTAEQLLKM